MHNQFHIYVYYNLIYTKQDDYDDSKKLFSSKEIAIITDQKIVKNILLNTANIVNEFGEFIDYDTNQIKNIVLNDIEKYGEKSKCDLEYEIESFYYIKCELIKKISE